jgi:hypothetical protein
MDLLLRSFSGSLTSKVEKFKECRVSPSLETFRCVIYGEFEFKADVTPTHMWLEYNGYIYDTIPGLPLRRKQANPTSRLSPGCVDGQYDPTHVASSKWFLSASHMAVLLTAQWVNDEYMPHMN